MVIRVFCVRDWFLFRDSLVYLGIGFFVGFCVVMDFGLYFIFYFE